MDKVENVITNYLKGEKSFTQSKESVERECHGAIVIASSQIYDFDIFNYVSFKVYLKMSPMNTSLRNRIDIFVLRDEEYIDTRFCLHLFLPEEDFSEIGEKVLSEYLNFYKMYSKGLLPENQNNYIILNGKLASPILQEWEIKNYLDAKYGKGTKYYQTYLKKWEKGILWEVEKYKDSIHEFDKIKVKDSFIKKIKNCFK